MWISRKEYKFLKENAEKNIDAECEILNAKDNKDRAVARAMEEYSSVLKERDELKHRVTELENRIDKTIKLNDVNYYPCATCNHGWALFSMDECKSCSDNCPELKEYCIREFDK